MHSLVWFRNDLRVHDNPALTAARQSGLPVIACYIATPGQWRAHDMAPIKARFLYQNLLALCERLAELNIPLLFAACDDFKACQDVLARWVRQHRVTALFYNREYAVNEVQRDRLVGKALQADCELQSFEDQCVVHPGEVLTQQGEPYRVFTPFSRAWHAHPAAQNCHLLPVPQPQASPGVAGDTPSADSFFLPGHIPDSITWQPGEAAAMRKLNEFASRQLGDYQKQRDFPDLDATSGLSPYLGIGVLSPRLCYRTALEAKFDVGKTEGAACWVSELIWREFYIHLLHHYPALCKYRAFKPQTEYLPWRKDDAGFQAWCEGRTGVPIVDAAMRQLQSRGWMHNRLRMICAMFLSKNLLVDWRRGERFFMRSLIDGHLAANNGGWQWAASTGTDAAPYFRIFNPVTQGQKFDPQGHFVRRYVPELAALPANRIHTPHSPRPDPNLDYPLPIVDLKSSRQRAIDAFAALASQPLSQCDLA